MFSILWKMPIVLILSTIKIEAGIAGLKALGFRYETSVVFSITWALIITALTYYSVNPVKRFLDKKMSFNGTNWTDKVWMEKIKKPIQDTRNKILLILLNHRIELSILLVVIPIIPFVDLAAIIVIRRSKIKLGLPILILATFGKIGITLFLIY